MYQRRLTYTCPRGYVIEQPAGVHYEQPDPIPEELETFEVECAANAVWTPRPLNGMDYMPYCIRNYQLPPSSSYKTNVFLAINCTEAPYPAFQNDLLMSNWTGIEGIHPRPYATAIKYFCRWKLYEYKNEESQLSVQTRGLGLPQHRRQRDSDQLSVGRPVEQRRQHRDLHQSVSLSQPPHLYQSLLIPELPCKNPPPPSLPGEGAERNYGPEITTYRCPNGYEWSTGAWPYLENECLNKRWQYRTSLPPCRSKCSPMSIFLTTLNVYNMEFEILLKQCMTCYMLHVTCHMSHVTSLDL